MEVENDNLYDEAKLTSQNSPLPNRANATIGRYVVLAVLYFVTVYLFFVQGSKHQPSTLWAPAGIALAGCLIWQYRFLPVVLVGSIAVSLAIQKVHLNSLDSFSISLALGLGLVSTFQSWINYRLIEHLSLDITNAPCLRKVATFIGVALVCCFFGGLATNILYQEFVTGHHGGSYWSNMAILWLGNFLGVIIITPILLVIFHSSHHFVQTLPQSRALVIPLILLLLTLAIIQKYTNEFVQNKIHHQIQVRSELVEKSLNHQLENYLDSLSSLAMKLSGNEDITQKEFRQIALPLIEQNQGIRALSWNPIIESDQVSAFEQNVDHDASSTFKVRGDPLHTNDPLVVVKWIEPFAANIKGSSRISGN
ncbi:MASE1 domain-containing protein [uncultured Vibrio sp.]|uniref:MASE1 domain-containing protein n=1 Tax=uncultured Vibrio sp. TaxID=114054 RepID=UPI002608465C|nr:MASE1 domain-containing protein [uncultured Vibrio sp.]